MDSITIGIREDCIVLINNTIKLGLGFTWQAADRAGRAICWKARRVIGPDKESIGPITISRDGEQIIVVVIANGQTALICPLEAAHKIGSALIAKAREREEWDVFEDLAFDQAILQRRGAFLGLTNNPRVQEEAGKQAAWNTDLRRYIPSSRNLRQRQVGTPQARHVNPVSKNGRNRP